MWTSVSPLSRGFFDWRWACPIKRSTVAISVRILFRPNRSDSMRPSYLLDYLPKVAASSTSMKALSTRHVTSGGDGANPASSSIPRIASASIGSTSLQRQPAPAKYGSASTMGTTPRRRYGTSSWSYAWSCKRVTLIGEVIRYYNWTMRLHTNQRRWLTSSLSSRSPSCSQDHTATMSMQPRRSSQ